MTGATVYASPFYVGYGPGGSVRSQIQTGRDSVGDPTYTSISSADTLYMYTFTPKR